VVAAIETMSRKKTILLGAGGMLGHALVQVFPDAMAFSHRDLDITDEDLVRKTFMKEQPAVVINAAAYTDVDGCEENREHAFAINGTAAGFIAGACNECGAALIHYSTDYVFDGKKQEYRENDPTGPVNVYGESKLAGEAGIAKNMDNFRIIRTSWLYGPHGKNFVDTILSLSEKLPEVPVVTDQIGKPTYTADLAQKTREIISLNPGIYHITNDGVCSWYEFARAFIPNAVPCSSAQFPRKARRPAYSVLTNTKTAPLRHWRSALAEYLEVKKT
jgi:dTDP-4-dehydrorhamnose reductase